MMDFGLKGKKALVTGGSTGIGFAIAQALVEEGASVIVSSREEENLKRAVSELRNAGGEAIALRMDVTNERSIREALLEIEKEHAIDILVNNVGGPAPGNALDVSLASWDQGYNSLFRSVIILSQSLLPGMRQREWGRVLNITSTSAKEIIPALAVSSSFRAGLSAWTKGVARDVGRSGVLINNLLPGPTKTARLQELEHKSPAFYNSMQSESGVGRIADPMEIARVAVFLLSAANTFLTGTDVLVDGAITKAV